MRAFAVSCYAEAYGFKRLGLLGSSNNQWLGSDLNTHRLFRFNHALANYDDSAEAE